MESSHKRIVTDLEFKNRVEIQRLLGEKETALAEETQVISISFLTKEFSNKIYLITGNTSSS